MASPLVELALASIETGESVTSDLVRSALKQHREEQQLASGKEIIELLKEIDTFKRSTVGELRKVRAQETTLKKSLNAVDLAWAYAEETNNFLPVLALFNKILSCDVPNPEDFEKLTTVPADWSAPAKK